MSDGQSVYYKLTIQVFVIAEYKLSPVRNR